MGSRTAANLKEVARVPRRRGERGETPSRRVLTVIFAVCLALDQISKYLVLLLIGRNNSLIVIPNVLVLKPVENTGFIFGLQGAGSAVAPLAATAALLAILIALALHSKEIIGPGWVLVLSGAVGNLLDRLIRAAVVDFIRVPLWPVFNVADILIVLGVATWLLQLCRKKRKA